MADLSSTPYTLLLLILNVLVSSYALFFDSSLLDRLAFKPREIIKGKQYYRLISGGFVHAGLAHLAFNMITLYFFGPLLETIMGPVRFLALYFGSELAAHGFTLMRHRDDPYYAAVGASGAISGVVFAFCLFFPFELLYIFFALPIPAIVFAVLYVVGSAYAMRQSDGVRGGIAHEAHLGGAIGGLVITIILVPRSLSIFLSHLGL